MELARKKVDSWFSYNAIFVIPVSSVTFLASQGQIWRGGEEFLSPCFKPLISNINLYHKKNVNFILLCFLVSFATEHRRTRRGAPAFENSGKFGQGLRILWANLGKAYDIFDLLHWIFWAIILFFSGKKGQAPHAPVARYAYATESPLLEILYPLLYYAPVFNIC